MNLYCTADQIGLESGGGKVTFLESLALQCSWPGPCAVWGRKELLEFAEEDFRNNRANKHGEPWCWDETSQKRTAWFVPGAIKESPRLAHFYAGSFSSTVENLKARGTKVTYTAAAHDIGLSRREHERLGLPFDYPHLTVPELWKRYVGGYLAADVVICPSHHSKRCMEGYGCRNVVVIPHGVDLPKCQRCGGAGKAYGSDRPFEWSGPGTYPGPCPVCNGTGLASVAPLPERFTVGYLGCCTGPDKGLIYLLQAWKKLDYLDAELVLAGRDSDSDFVHALAAACGMVSFKNKQPLSFKGASPVVRSVGWIENVSDFYNQLSLYVQPSVTEGFGIEVLEAMAHGRPVLCSDGAGAVDLVRQAEDHCGRWIPAADVDALADGIGFYKDRSVFMKADGSVGRQEAEKYTWPLIRQRYVDLWKGLL